MEARPLVISDRIVRQIENNSLQIIAEFVGLEVSLRTIVKMNSNFKI